MASDAFNPPSHKENLFHVGAAVGSGGTPRKRNRFRRAGMGGRSPLGGSVGLGADVDVATAAADGAAEAASITVPPSASMPPVSVTITSEMLSALSAEERALIEKLSGKIPALKPTAVAASPARPAAQQQPTTPPPLAPKAFSPPEPPPPPQPPTPSEPASTAPQSKVSVAADAAAAAAADVVAAAAVAASSGACLFTIGAGGPPPPRKKGISPPAQKGASAALPVPPAPPPAASVPFAPFQSPVEAEMPDAEVSPVFSMGVSEDASARRSSRERRAAAKPARRPPAVSEATASDATSALEGGLSKLGLSEPATGAAAATTVAPADLWEAAAGVFNFGSVDESAHGTPRRAGRRRVNQAQRARSPLAPAAASMSVPTQQPLPAQATAAPHTQPTVAPMVAPPPPRSAWEGFTFGAGAPIAGVAGSNPPNPLAATAEGASASTSAAPPPAAPPTATAPAGEQAVDPSWRLAEDQKERGNRRYAIKSYSEANTCYHKAIGELKKHPAFGTATPEGRALNSKAASYHANSAAALMQLGKMSDAVAECDAALSADRRLGKALLRVAHVQLMLGDTDEARRYYVEAASVGHLSESETGLKACADDEQQAARLHAELIMCRRAAASTVGSAASSAQLKGLVNSLETACTRSPHNITLRSLQAEALSASGRMTEAHALCEAQLATPPAHRGHAATWLYTLGRVLYDSSLLPEAADKLTEALQRPHAPAGAKPLARLVQRLEAERSEGNNAFKRSEWSKAIEAYTRALAVDPTHARFNSLLYCNRGAAHDKNESLQQALADCSAAIALNRSYAKAYLRRGQLRAKCGDRARATEDFGAAQRLDASGPVGQEAAKRMSDMRKESAREAAAAAAAAAGANANFRGWDRARAGYGPSGQGRAGGSGSHAGSSSYGNSSSGGSGSGSGKQPNHYEILGIETTATADEIRKAYKKMCLKYHPDKTASSSEAEKSAAQQRFLEVQKAHDVLSDVLQRRTYDNERSRSRAGFGGGWNRGGFGFGSEEDLFASFYGRSRAGGARR